MTSPNDPDFSADIPEPTDGIPQPPSDNNISAGSFERSSPQSPQYAQPLPGAEKKIAAGICGILLGYLGIHKFILGYNTEGIIMLAVSLAGALFSCLFLPILGSAAMTLIGIIEGVIYLTKTDQEFVDTYIVNQKTWF